MEPGAWEPGAGSLLESIDIYKLSGNSFFLLYLIISDLNLYHSNNLGSMEPTRQGVFRVMDGKLVLFPSISMVDIVLRLYISGGRNPRHTGAYTGFQKGSSNESASLPPSFLQPPLPFRHSYF